MRARIQIGSGIILRISRLHLADELEMLGRSWRAKREHHVTLLNSDATRAVGFSRIDAARTGVRFDVHLRDELWIVFEGTAATLIRTCDVPQSASFFRSVGVPSPPLHVTLYTSGTLRGIGIPTTADLHRMGRRLSAEETSAALEQMRESRR